MQLINNITPNYPNQQVLFTANNQNFTLNLYWRGYQNAPPVNQAFINTYAVPAFFADIYLNNKLIIAGTPVIDRTPINLYPSVMTGYILSVDTSGNANPNLENLGKTVFMYFLNSLVELALIPQDLRT